MYTVSKGPSKIVAKTRRGIRQNLERLDSLRDLSRRNESDASQEINRQVPKPVFFMNGKSKLHTQRHQQTQETITPQHEELIKFVHEAWVSTKQRSTEDPECLVGEYSTNSVVYYNGGESSDALRDFKPFDLESWWGKRLFTNITKSL